MIDQQQFTIQELKRETNPLNGSVRITYRINALQGCKLEIPTGPGQTAFCESLTFTAIQKR